MLSRLLRSSLIAACALALGTGTVFAQDGEGDWSEEGGGDGGGGEGGSSDVAPPPEDGGDGVDGAAAAAGAIKAGLMILLPSGPDDMGEIGIGSWIEVRPWVSYQVTPEISAGVTIPLMLVKPDLGEGYEIDALQAIIVNGSYQVNPNIAGKGIVGMGVPGRLAINPFGGVFAPGGSGDSKIGFGAGGGYVHQAGKITVSADVLLVVQLDSDADDEGEPKPLIVAHVPIMVMYPVNDQLSAGVGTGIYTGSDLAFSADDGMTVPFVVGGKFKVNDNLSVGGFAGLSSIVVPDLEGFGVGDTMTVGLFAGWAQ